MRKIICSIFFIVKCAFSADVNIHSTTDMSYLIGNATGPSTASINCDGNVSAWSDPNPAQYATGAQYLSGSTHCHLHLGTQSLPNTTYIQMTLSDVGWDGTIHSNGTNDYSYPDSLLPAGQYAAFFSFCAGLTCEHSLANRVKGASFQLDGNQLLSSIKIPAVPSGGGIIFAKNNLSNVDFDASFCVGIINQTTGVVYGTGQPYSCDNAIDLPPATSPVNCSINNNNQLNVPMGSINHTDIGTVAGGNGNVTLSVPVSCDSASDVPASLTLSYTPLAGGGDAAVSTSLANLGVSVRLNSAVWGNNAVNNVTPVPGNNTLNLDFTPVTRAGVSSADIPVGDYSASASLVMTWQ